MEKKEQQRHLINSYMRLFLKTIILLTSLPIIFNSCLFDKDIKQDNRIATYRYEMLKVADSLSNEKSILNAYHFIMEQIEQDKDLITARKKNNLIIECYFYIGAEYYKHSKYKQSMEQYNKAIAIDSTNASAYYFRGNIYDALQKPDSALQDYNKALSLNSDLADAYYNRGIIYELRGEYELALADYTKAIKIKPKYTSDIYTNRGNTYQEMNNGEKALADYNKAIELDSLNMIAYCNRGNILVNMGQYDNAINDYTRAIMFDSINADLYNKRAFTYELKKEYDSAVADYDRVIDLDHRNRLKQKEKALKGMERIRTLKKHKR